MTATRSTLILSASPGLPGVCGPVAAGPLDLQVVASYQKASPYGLAYDGVNLWWSDFHGVIHEMRTNGVETGATMANPSGGSALAWTGTQLLWTRGTTARFFDRFSGANQVSVCLEVGGGACESDAQWSFHSEPVDGLDFDHGEIWWSPHAADIYRFASDGTFPGEHLPILTGRLAGIERIDTAFASLLVYESLPLGGERALCAADQSGTVLGCGALPGISYEDLAFDGRYLWAANMGSGTIDRIDVTRNGTSFFAPDSAPIPEPTVLALLGSALVAALVRRLPRRPRPTA